MSKGFVVLAQNTADTDYVGQAGLLAKTIARSQLHTRNISLITNDSVPKEYLSYFDKIIPIPFEDQASNSEWKVENRWKIYHASPYDETIVLDADMIITTDLSACWKFVADKNLFFTSTVKNYKGINVTDVTYRKTFVENNLPNLYSGMFYFKKSDEALSYFKLVEYISYNWERFFFEVTPKNMQKFFSMDVTFAIAAKLLHIEDSIVHLESPFTFTHMKPALQDWQVVPGSCYSQVDAYFNSNNELYVGNYRQLGVFHYVEDSFLNNSILENINGRV